MLGLFCLEFLNSAEGEKHEMILMRKMGWN